MTELITGAKGSAHVMATQRVINNNGSRLADSQIATITAVYGVM